MRRHLDEFTCNLQIHALHLGEIGEILVKDIGDFQITDLYFVFGQQHQDQAERTFKVLQLVLFPDDAFKMKVGIFHTILTEQ